MQLNSEASVKMGSVFNDDSNTMCVLDNDFRAEAAP
jgi:hypothetical protein